MKHFIAQVYCGCSKFMLLEWLQFSSSIDFYMHLRLFSIAYTELAADSPLVLRQ